MSSTDPATELLDDDLARLEREVGDRRVHLYDLRRSRPEVREEVKRLLRSLRDRSGDRDGAILTQ